MDWSVQHLHFQQFNSGDQLWSEPHQSISWFCNHWWLQWPLQSLGSCPTTRYSRWQDHILFHQQWYTRIKRWLCYSHQLNHRQWQHTQLITLWLQLDYQSIMDTSRTCWQLRPPTNYHRHQPQNQIPNSHSKEGPVMVLTGSLLLTMLNHECNNFQKSLTFQSISLDSTTLSRLQSHFASPKPNRVINQSLGSNHTSKQRSTNVTRLHHTIHQNQQEWINSCQEENVAINKA